MLSDDVHAVLIHVHVHVLIYSDLITIDGTLVADLNSNSQILTLTYDRIHPSVCIIKRGVRQPIPKRIQWVSVEITIRSPLHAVVYHRWYLKIIHIYTIYRI